MGILPLKKRVNRDKCSFATKQRMFGVFAIDEILRYRGTRFPGSRTLCHPVSSQCTFLQREHKMLAFFGQFEVVCCEFFALFGVLLQAQKMQWCTKVDKYQVYNGFS